MDKRINKIIESWPSNKHLAEDLGLLDESHCRVFKARGRIPRAYWHDMVAAARRRRIKGITIEHLRKVHKNIGVRPS